MDRICTVKYKDRYFLVQRSERDVFVERVGKPEGYATLEDATEHREELQYALDVLQLYGTTLLEKGTVVYDPRMENS